MRMKLTRDPYRRPFWLITVWLPALSALFVFYGFAQGVGSRPDRPTWGQAIAILLGLDAGLLFLVAWMLIGPAPRAIEHGGKRVLRMSTWRRAWIAVGLPGLGWPVALWAFSRGELVPGIVASVLAAGFTVVILHGTSECITYDTEGVRKVKGTGAKDQLRWSDVNEVHVWPSGVMLKEAGRARVPVAGVLLDGYPEFVRELLDRVRPEVIDATPGSRTVLERVAALTGVREVRGG